MRLAVNEEGQILDAGDAIVKDDYYDVIEVYGISDFLNGEDITKYKLIQRNNTTKIYKYK